MKRTIVPGILLFSCVNKGKVFLLKHKAGFRYGSISLENVTSETRVRVVIYPTLSHHIKSLLHISYDVPLTMSGV